MKIVYICLSGLYIPGWSYQENILSKYHIYDGHEVTIIAANWTYDKNGRFVPYLGKEIEYDHGAKIIRLKIRHGKSFKSKLKRYIGLRDSIESENPDLIYVHGPQILDADVICKYLKNHSTTKLIVDNHNDKYNSAKNFLSKYILHKIIWRRSVKALNKYAVVFWGVTPARMDFLVNMYGVSSQKVKLLPFGADDEMVEQAIADQCRDKIRSFYRIMDDDILILTGGKIDHNKPETLTLMEATIMINNPHVKLMVYGSVIPDLLDHFNKLIDSPSIIYVGWQKPEDIYCLQEAADLIAFPGLHSVLWEQSVGSGKPCLFRRIEGFTHVDLNGNCEFFEGLTADEMRETIEKIIYDGKIELMTQIAMEKGKKVFSYKQIAKDCLTF